eukprot:TRINITY_DN16916_c0_g1_i1.p1 TRINITY_DN16916_c0_g1~~TRINITY_DN16916_c0_g1_i1.p1  ORF type:complete len:661 (+),score=41.11 TRINITY_DN16916_c0_g1_i1:278-1984(+)
MILGSSGGGWGIGLYYNGYKKPVSSKIGDFSYRTYAQYNIQNAGLPWITWRTFVAEQLLKPGGIREDKLVSDQERKEVSYVTVAFTAEDAERPDLLTYNGHGFCFVHGLKCYAWSERDASLSLIDVLTRTSYVSGTALDVSRLPPYSVWKSKLRREGVVTRPSWYPVSVRNAMGAMMGVGVDGDYAPTTSDSEFAGITVSDGGLLDNSAILPGLAAGHSRVITQGIGFDMTIEQALNRRYSKYKSVTMSEEVLQLFGAFSEKSVKGNYISLNQVFHETMLTPIAKALRKSVKHGFGGVVTARLQTIENSYWHIEAGRLVTITFVTPQVGKRCKHAQYCVGGIEKLNPDSCNVDSRDQETTVESVRGENTPASSNSTPTTSRSSLILPTLSEEEATAESSMSESMRDRFINGVKSRILNPVSQFSPVLTAAVEVGALSGITAKSTKMPQLPLLVPRMDGEYKSKYIKCANLVFGFTRKLAEVNSVHFTKDPFALEVQREAATRAMLETFVNLEGQTCETIKQQSCRINMACVWKFGKASVCRNGQCACKKFTCFHDGKCTKVRAGKFMH